MSDATPNVTAEEDITVDYANNTMFEPTIWDLKIIFGEYSQRTQTVEYHTSITIPWAQAKLMLYYLQANVTAHEINSGGTIKVPDAVVPPEWDPPNAEQSKDPKTMKIYEAIQKLRAEFIKGQK